MPRRPDPGSPNANRRRLVRAAALAGLAQERSTPADQRARRKLARALLACSRRAPIGPRSKLWGAEALDVLTEFSSEPTKSGLVKSGRAAFDLTRLDRAARQGRRMILQNWCTTWLVEEWAEARVWMDHCSIGARLLAAWQPTDPVHVATHELFQAYLRRSLHEEGTAQRTAREVLDVAEQLGPKWTRMPGYFAWLLERVRAYWRDPAGNLALCGAESRVTIDGEAPLGRQIAQAPAETKSTRRPLSDQAREIWNLLMQLPETEGRTAKQIVVELSRRGTTVDEDRVRRLVQELRTKGYPVERSRAAGYFVRNETGTTAAGVKGVHT